MLQNLASADPWAILLHQALKSSLLAAFRTGGQRLDTAPSLSQLTAKIRLGQLSYDQTLNHGFGNQWIVGQSRQHRIGLVMAKEFDPGSLVRIEVILVNDDCKGRLKVPA
jgi:hypothetical protein